MRVIEEAFRILRVNIEAKAPPPSVIAVTSALHGDGTTYVACGLARAFAEAGYSTLIVDANGDGLGVEEELGTRDLWTPLGGGRTRDSGVPRLSVKSLPTGTPLDVNELIVGIRSAHEVTIFDTPPITGSSVAIEIARAVDNVLIAVRLGRRLQSADHDLRKLIADFETRVLGVVPTRAGRRKSQARDGAEDPEPETVGEQASRPTLSIFRSRSAM